MTQLEVIDLIRSAIQYGDSGLVPFTDKEYDAMFRFLDKQENTLKKTKRNE